MFKKLIYTIILFAIMGLFSCEKYTIIQGKEYFPNTVGSLWIYKVTDSLQNKTYELEVRIVKDTLIKDLHYTKWTYSCHDYVKSKYVLVENDSIFFKMLATDSTLFTTDILIMPFEKGSVWEFPVYGSFDSNYEVEDITDMKILNCDFTQVSIIRKNAGSPNNYITNRFYIKPNTGIVRFDAREIMWSTIQNEVWELKRCNLN